MTEVIAYRLNELVAGESVNVRPRDEDVAELVASIRAHGLLQPLVGRDRGDGKVEIVDGNRRLKAMQLIDAVDDAADVSTIEWVHVVLRPAEAEADAFEISLAANVLRKPLHPVREFEAFADLIDKGKDKQAIADHFGIPLRAVEQRLALGRLHEDVRAAWLEGRITGEAARAFTLAAPADQAAYLAKVQPGWQLNARSIREAFTADTMEASNYKARFVGREAYLAAGGAFILDLFTDEPDYADGALVQRLANEKLAAEAQRIREAEGWAEVLFGEAANQSYLWDRITKPTLPDAEKPARAIEIEQRLQAIAARRQEIEDALDGLEWDEDAEPPEVTAQLREDDDLAAEQPLLERELKLLTEQATWMVLPESKRAKAVAIVKIDNYDGTLSVVRGFLKDQKPKPAPKPTAIPAPAPKPSADGEEAPEPTRLSAALMDELALTATRAAAHVVAAEPRLALALFVATAATLGSPVRFKSEGRSEGPGLPWNGRDYNSKTRFVDVLKSTVLLSIDELQHHAAKCVAHMLDFTSKAIVNHSMDALKPEAAQAVRAALPLVDHRAALVQAFDAADYFSKAPKQEAITAIAECGDDPGKYAKLKKADLGATAARLANARGWLPATLRGEIFDAVLPEEPEAEDQGEQAGEHEGSAEPETAESAAEAAQRIWQDQERARLGVMKTPDVRAEFTARGIKVPFGKSKNQMIEMLLAQPAETEEAA
ncbi:ParB/RepB/Spo0J family partition protein [Bosea sp. ASV33]|uniref:ParB/RepB/Spo0J family partition protein n=1 Tax=Bosea sp. ASV33 TaxID=2795106 RepID=UPI0018EDE4A7|nr:ParB/RepB/Spo0J family partition protein [Bosea sp. ASV33]